MNDNRLPSIVAAHQAADAVAALLLHADEDHFGDIDVVAKLAEALTIATGLRMAEIEVCDHGYRAALDALQSAAAAFLESWA